MTIDIKRMRELHAATTQGEYLSAVGWVLLTETDTMVAECHDAEGPISIECENANARFFAEAHNNWLAMCEEIETQRQQLAEYRSLVGIENVKIYGGGA